MSPPSNTEELAAAGLRVEVTAGIATITLDRQPVMNAQTPTMWRALAAIGTTLVDSDAVDVAVVRGAGSSFSSGLDRSLLMPGGDTTQESVADLFAMDDATFDATVAAWQQGFAWLGDPGLVSIAAVHGYAIGAGFQLALACDVIVAGDTAQFCMREAALGLVPDLGGTRPLVARVGYARALEICATSRMVGAEEAVRTGIALRQVAEADLNGEVERLAVALAGVGSGVLGQTKSLLLGASTLDTEAQRRAERQAQLARFRAIAE